MPSANMGRRASVLRRVPDLLPLLPVRVGNVLFHEQLTRQFLTMRHDNSSTSGLAARGSLSLQPSSLAEHLGLTEGDGGQTGYLEILLG